MKEKKLYISPIIVEIFLDEEISLFLSSEGGLKAPPKDQEPLSVGGQAASYFESVEDTNKSFDENPFRE